MAGHDVFLSYSSKDKLAADAVCHGLEARNIKCWMAPRDQVAGKPYGEQITEAIQSAKVMVLVFSDNVNNSHAVHNEVDLAAGASVTIIPFRITSATFNPELRFYLGRVHWLDAFPLPVGHYVDNLAATVRRNLDNTEPDLPPDHGPDSPAPALHDDDPNTPAPPAPQPRPQPVPPVINPAAGKNGPTQILMVVGGLLGLLVLSAILLAVVLPNSMGTRGNDANRTNPPLNSASPPVNNGSPQQPTTPEQIAQQRTPEAWETLQIPNGPPTSLQGAAVINTATLAQFLNQAQPGTYLLVDARGCTNEPVIPGSVCINHNDVDSLRQRATSATMPLIFYCHDGGCDWSYHLADAAVRSGYTSVYWYRGGINAWMAARLPITRYQGAQP